MADRQLTQEYVRSLFDYDPETGVLTWKERPREHFNSNRCWNSTNSRCLGKPAGKIDAKGYVVVGVDGAQYKAHRVIWLWCNGVIPVVIDHDNGIRSDNRISNLVDTTHSGNMKNMSRSRANKSGNNGVVWHKSVRKWVAEICANRQKHHLGVFASKDEAIAARLKAEKELGFHESHGRRKAHVL